MKRWLAIWWSLSVFVIVLVVGFVSKVDEVDGLSSFYNALDTASSVALAVLAFVGYYQYTNDKRKTYRLKKKIEKARRMDSDQGAILVSFGGRSNMIEDMRHFARNELKLEKNVIVEIVIGDENAKISAHDIPKLKEKLEEAMRILSYVDEVHLLYGSVGIGYFVCADVLKNWKKIHVYHNDNGYKHWYTDLKHLRKIEAQKPSYYA